MPEHQQNNDHHLKGSHLKGSDPFNCFNWRLLLISLASVMALAGCGNSNTPAPVSPPLPPAMACASYTNSAGDELTAIAARTRAAPNCVYEASFVDNDAPLTESITLTNLDSGGVHVFSGSLVVGADSATRGGGADSAARVDAPATVVLTIEPGATIAFTNAANRVIVNRGAQIMAVGTEAAPITFTSMADVDALASADTADLAADAVNQWAGITINGAALNNACTYSDPDAGAARRGFTLDAPFALADPQPTLTATTCNQGAAVFTAGATTADAATLAYGFHGGTSPADDSGRLDYVIIKHVGDATAGTNRNALHLRSVGSATRLGNIEVYSVDGSGVRVDGGGADLNNVLVYNPQEHGVQVTGGYLGTLNTVLVSQADGAGAACVQVDAGAGGMTQVQIDDGMNTRVTARNLTCDVSANNADGAGVVVLTGARARIQNAIIVGSRVAANTTNPNDNVCLDLGDSQSIGQRAIIEVDGVIASCLDAPGVATAANFLDATPTGDRLIATDALATPTAEAVATDIQFHAPGAATTISPLAGTNPGLVLLYDVGTLESRALFSLPLSESRVEGTTPTVVVSGTTASRTYLGAIAAGTGNNPFFGWTFGVFTATPPPLPPLPPPLPPAVACASYTNADSDTLTAIAARTLIAPNCVYEASFVDNDTPLTASIRLANLDVGGVHVFNGSLIVGAGNATLEDVPGTAVVLTIEAGTTVAFADAADRVIVNRGAQIEAVGTAAAPITFTSLADVEALATADPADDLAADAVNQWGGISINGRSFNNACIYSNPGTGIARRSFTTNNPFRLTAHRDLAVGNCSEGTAVSTPGATAADPATLGDGFHGGNNAVDDSGELAYVIIKHVGDAATGVNRNALNLRSVGEPTTLNNIEVYSVDGTGIVIDGGYDVSSGERDESSLSNILVYNAQTHGVQVTGGFLGLLDGVLVSQADGTGEACIQVDGGALGMSAAEIADGMNTRVTARNLTCDVSADNAGGAGVIVTEGARARIQNAIIAGTRVAADATVATDNVCLELVGTRSIIEADGVLSACLETSTVVTATNFAITNSSPGNRVIATDITTSTRSGAAMDVQIFATLGTPISPLATTNPSLALLSAAGTQGTRALFSLLLNASTINLGGAVPTVVASSATASRTYLGAIAEGAGNNPFFGWTFGVFTATPPPVTPPPAVGCASYTNAGGDDLTAMAAPTAAAPNCIYEASFVDNETPLTTSIRLANLDAGGVHVFNGSLVVGADSATVAGIPAAAVVLIIEAGATIAFANAADRVIVNRGAQIEAVGTAADPITFTSLADVNALATTATTDDLAADAVNQWGGITINGQSQNNACTYDAAGGGNTRREFMDDDPYALKFNQNLTLSADCSLGGPVVTADGFHGGQRSRDNSGELAYVIIKHVGDAAVDATTSAPVNRNALHLRSVGDTTRLSNIEVYSVDGTGIRLDGGYSFSSRLSNALVYNAQEHGIHVTGGYLGVFDGVLVSQADGVGNSCIQVDSGVGGMSAAEITDGMNTRVTARNLTCDVSADNAGGAGVIVTEGARARLQNAIISGSGVAADATNATDNVCLELVGSRSFIEADGVIASCLEASTVVTAANFLEAASPADRVIATDATTPTAAEVAMDIQFHAPGAATTVSPLAATDPELALLSAAGTLETRALFSEILSASGVRVDNALTTVLASGIRAYIGAIAAGTGNNPFFGWTFGVFTATPPPTPPLGPTMACASYTNADGDELTAMTARTLVAPNCVYEASFVDNDVPLTADITLANLDEGGVHLFSGSLVVGEGSPTLANVPTTPVVLTIEAGATIAFANAANRVIVNRGAQIEAVGTAAAPITFTSLADVVALANDDPADDLADDAVNQWAGITINGAALNNACTYGGAAAGEPSRPFVTDSFTLADPQPDLTASCSLGDAASSFHGGTSPDDDSGELAYVIIKHVGDATASVNWNALHLRSVGSATTLGNIEVYSVDGSGIRVDGGGADLSNVLVYNPQEHGVHATGGYLGLLDGVLVSQADGAGLSCVQVDAGAGGMSATEITDGMNTRAAARNLTCDVSADNAGGAGVIVTEGARARLQNAIIVGSRVAADAAAPNDNACLDLVGSRSIVEVDGVIAACLEASASTALRVRVQSKLSTFTPGNQFIATNTTIVRISSVLRDFQLHPPGTATTISPLVTTDGLIVLSDEGTLGRRALFSLLLSASRVDNDFTRVVVSAATGDPARTYLGAISHRDFVRSNNPFDGWTFGVFGTPTTPPPPPPPPPPPSAPTVACASYTNEGVTLTAMTARTAAAPNCVYETSFVDNGMPIPRPVRFGGNVVLANLDAGGVHVFEGSLIIEARRALIIEAGATIAFANADDRVIINTDATIEAIGTVANPITFTSLADVNALASVVTTDDLAATATDQWAGITINGEAPNNACTYDALDVDADGNVPPRRPFVADAPFTLADPQPDLRLVAGAGVDCNLGAAVFTAGATTSDAPTLADGFHGGTDSADNSGEMAYVIIKHVGDATAGTNRNALQLRSVGSDTKLSNIEVYSVDGSGIAIDGGAAELSNVLVYNAQGHGIDVTGGYLGVLDGVLVSQADGTGEACVQVDAGAGGMTVAEITDGMNTRMTARNLTCDVSAGNLGGAGVVIGEGVRARVQNAIIVGSRVAADATAANDNACLELFGDRSIIEADGVIASCLEAPTNVTVANFEATTGVGAQVIATDASATPTAAEVAMDIQFHDPGVATTISPLAATNTGLVVLSVAGTADTRALFSLLLSASTVNNAAPTVVVSAAGPPFRPYLGAIASGVGNNPFSRWTFGVFVTP